MSHSFPRDRRLLSAGDFQRVFDQAQKSSDACFTVLARVREAESQSLSRLGLAIAKKQLKRAVDRNRIKRLSRECFRQCVPHDCRIDFVVLARAAVLKRSNPDLARQLERHFFALIEKSLSAPKHSEA